MVSEKRKQGGIPTNKINVPISVKKILNTLAGNGYRAYIVGGCVRDALLGREPMDWDICTSAHPEKIKACFPDNNIIETGLKHGTVTLVMDDSKYEITTFRKDGNYTDVRRPDTVEFISDIKEDLARRDFSMNAIAFNEADGMVDPFGGVDDLRAGVISCVGNPNDRFNEDALRILRALRFSSIYGFKIEDATAKAAHENAYLLNRIAPERINAELCKLLTGQNVLQVLLKFHDIITTIIPVMKPCIGFDQNNKYHQYTVYTHIAHAVANYGGSDIRTLVALLLHDIGKPLCYIENETGGHFYGHAESSYKLASYALDRLKFDNNSKRDILELILHHDDTIEPTSRAVKRCLNKIGFEQFLRLMDIRLADIQAQSEYGREIRIEKRNAVLEIARDIMKQKSCFSLKDLAINGKDVMSLGVPEGKEVGEALRAALNAVIDGDLPNKKEALMSLIGDLPELKCHF